LNRAKPKKVATLKEDILMGGEGSGRPEPAKRGPDGQYKKEGCFIATAVYGSYEAPEVVILRHFRDSQLKNTAFGNLMITIYYFLSPAVARVILKSSLLSKISRSVLDTFIKCYGK
jgi:hypothetical protein